MSARCTICDASFDGREVRQAPMLLDQAWARIAGPRDNLCMDCFWQRLDERGVRAELAILKPCSVNLFHRPYSHFDLFTRSKNDLPVDIQAWAKAERDVDGGPDFQRWLDEQWEEDQ